MTYRRVIPRDLFNEGNLLKCLGRLSCLLDCRDGRAKLDEGDGSPFRIEQDPSTGSLSCTNLPFTIDGRPYRLTRPLNSRDAWPLYAENDDEAVPVFEDDGNLTDEFERLIGALTDDEDDGMIGTCTCDVCGTDYLETEHCPKCKAAGS